jgi:N,N-dimethylformamidase
VKVLVTSTHPEYVSVQMLDALEDFLRRGGSLLYLGGNGFYWVTSCSRDTPHRIEVRRSHAGIRTWESPPGEDYHSTTGEPGGLWRYRGRAPNRLVGVGMAAQGWDSKAPGYQRAPEGSGPLVDELLAGVAAETIGDYGYAMNGAAGDEIDRMDTALGTPPQAQRILTSTGHSRYYKLAVEDVPTVIDGLDGTRSEMVRADVCAYPTGFGGHIFSVGSITWAASMAWADYDNDIARVSRNALRVARRSDPFPDEVS